MKLELEHFTPAGGFLLLGPLGKGINPAPVAKVGPGEHGPYGAFETPDFAVGDMVFVDPREMNSAIEIPHGNTGEVYVLVHSCHVRGRWTDPGK